MKNYHDWLHDVAENSHYLFYQSGGAGVFHIYAHAGLDDDRKFLFQGPE